MLSELEDGDDESSVVVERSEVCVSKGLIEIGLN